jgi:hypothetical protein
MDQWDEKAEALLIQFPNDWSPACQEVINAVAAELRKLGEVKQADSDLIFKWDAKAEALYEEWLAGTQIGDRFKRLVTAELRAAYLKGFEDAKSLAAILDNAKAEKK